MSPYVAHWCIPPYAAHFITPCTSGLPKGMDARSWRDGEDAPHSPLVRGSWARARRLRGRGFDEEDAE